MIKVEMFLKGGKFGNNPNETFIVKNQKKIEFWKSLAARSSLIVITQIK